MEDGPSSVCIYFASSIIIFFNQSEFKLEYMT